MLTAQDTYFQDSTLRIQEKAQKVTDQYNDELALTAKQDLLFQKKVEEFLIRRNKIETTLVGKEQLDALYKMQVQETKEMGDILTRPQMDLYKKIKSTIQPIKVVND